jgi:hypothetical protein
MSLQLRLMLPFDKGIVFRGFLPDTKEKGLELCLEGGKYRVRVYLPEPGQSVSGQEYADQITSGVQSVLDKVQGAWVTLGDTVAVQMPKPHRVLIMTMEVAEPDPGVVTALEAGEITGKTREFGEEIFREVTWVHDRLVNYLRGVAKQYWVEPLGADPANCHYFLLMCHTEWLDLNGNWRRLLTGPIAPDCAVWTNLAVPINRTRWGQIGSFIMQEGGRAPIRDMLVANSLRHLSQRNGNMAVVEAVAALESAMKTIVAEVVKSQSEGPTTHKGGGSTLEEADIQKLVSKLVDNVLEDAGLRVAAKVGLSIIRASVGCMGEDIDLTSEDIDRILKAIEARNNLLHHGQRKPVPLDMAWIYLSAILAAIAMLDTWKAHMLSPDRLPSV